MSHNINCYRFFETSHRIDFTTLKPRWKVVATSTSQSVTIPAGYRKYRVSFSFDRPANTWGCLRVSEKSGDAWIYIQGVGSGNWVQAERTTGSGDKSVIDLARVNISAGLSVYHLDLFRSTKTSGGFQAVYEATCAGTLTYVSGKSAFSVSNGSANMTFSTVDAGSNYAWVVEAFDE